MADPQSDEQKGALKDREQHGFHGDEQKGPYNEKREAIPGDKGKSPGDKGMFNDLPKRDLDEVCAIGKEIRGLTPDGKPLYGPLIECTVREKTPGISI